MVAEQATTGWISPPYARHLLTLEGVPRDVLSADETIWFVSRCICGSDIPPGPYERTEAAIRGHLAEHGLIQVTAPEPEREAGRFKDG